MTFESMLEHTIYKYTLTSSQNELGEWVASYTTSGSIDARFIPASDEDVAYYGGRYENLAGKIYVDYSESIKPGDRISYENQMYLVNEVLYDSEHTYKKLIVSWL